MGRRTKLRYPNGVSTSYRYNDSGRLTRLEHRNRYGRPINDFTYTLDRVGNRLTKQETNTTTNYGYDAIYRLISAQRNRHHNDRNDERYSYDPMGNRLTGPAPRTSYNYDTGYQLLKRDGTSFTFDKNGNLIERRQDNDKHEHREREWKYTFDYENRLIRAENGNIIVSFAYDPFGRRIEKRIEINGHGKGGHDVEEGVTSYLYDGLNIIQETWQSHHHAKHSETTTYLHGPNIDEPIAAERDQKSWYYHADGLGSIVALTGRHGNVIQEYGHDSFGNMQHQGESINQPFTYTGREWDRETGLYYYRARYYDSTVGRFISRDPIGFASGDVNLYEYVSNNPINWIDSYGLYGRDVHYDETRYLAVMAGFNLNDATEIAIANQSVDEDWISSPFNYSEGTKLHFMSQTEAKQLVRKTIKSCNIGAFGVALHIFQDTYSHARFSWKLGHIFAGKAPDNFSYGSSRDIEMINNSKYYISKLREKCKCKK